MKYISIIVVVLAVVGIGWWVMKGQGPMPGELITDQGREHWERAKLETFQYNSNPPVSGPHDSDWIRPGIYNEPQDKYKLIHSLEHGYIVVHYNCALPISNSQHRVPRASRAIFKVSAHEDNGQPATASREVKTGCALGQQLGDFAKKMTLFKMIVVPNPSIDKPIIMAAWDRMLKMDAFDEKLAEKFVKAFRNKGPEQTME